MVTWRRAQMVLLSAQGMDLAAIAKVTLTTDNRVRMSRREHVTVRLQAHPVGAVIKASEFTDNAVGLIHTVGAKAHKLADKDTRWRGCSGR